MASNIRQISNQTDLPGYYKRTVEQIG